QTKLTGFKRIANVQKAFAIIDVKTVADKNIIIVDDIATTGASLKEAAQTLLKAGARQVWGFVLARD
ncbi:MAG: phosphoribosyltransferase family protein, partial [Candidatus Jacksonbacteria bacterium]